MSHRVQSPKAKHTWIFKGINRSLFHFQTVTLAVATSSVASTLRNLKELGNNIQSFQRDLGQVWSGFSTLVAGRES